MKRPTNSDKKGGKIGRLAEEMMENPPGVYRALFYATTIFFLLTTLFPIYWLLAVAITPNNQMANIGLLPPDFNITVFITVFEEIQFHRYIINSIVIASITTCIVLILGSLAGYAFGRFEFKGRLPLLIGLLIVSYFPPAAFFLPLYQILTGQFSIFGLSSPDLFNHAGGIIVPLSGLTMPLSIYILTIFYSQIPDGLEDAARIEGCTRIGALFRVIAPLSAPGVATAGVLTFITVYNEFFFSFLMTTGEPQNWAPLVWGILQFQGTSTQPTTAYNLMAAASFIGLLPVAALIYAAQERIISGLTAGAVKE